MTLRALLIRTEIKLLLKHFPHQVKDILDEQGRHIQGHRQRKEEKTVHVIAGGPVMKSPEMAEHDRFMEGL